MNKDSKLQLKVWQLILMIVLSLVLVFCLLAIILNIKNQNFIYSAILSLVGYVGIIFYTIYGYKIPHGNSLRYVFLVFAVSLALYAIHIYEYYKITGISCALAVIVIGFISGRLDRDSQNIYLTTLVSFLLAAGLVSSVIKDGASQGAWLIIAKSNFLFQFLFLTSVYLIRYSKHKEAGEAK